MKCKICEMLKNKNQKDYPDKELEEHQLKEHGIRPKKR